MSNRQSSSLVASLAACLSVLVVCAAGTAFAQGRSQATLGDLQIPASRVPVWHHADHLPIDTSSWTVTNVPCGNGSTIQSAVNAAGPNTVLQLAANCTYSFPSSTSTFTMGKSYLVLRGAGRHSTILEFEHNDSTGILLGLQGWPVNEVFGDSRSWTGGYELGDDVLTLSSTSGLQPGGWVRLRANNEPDWNSRSRNGYSAKLDCVGTNAAPGQNCSGLSSNQVRLDRPLNSTFTQGGQQLDRVTGPVVEFSGIENLRIQHRTPDRVESYRARLKIEDCHECWVVDNSFGDAGNAHIVMADSSRVAIRGNDFGWNQCTDEGQRCLWNKGAIYYNEHAYDTVFENNAVVDTPSGPLLQNGGGNIVAYNYLTSNPSVECERHIFLHGQGVRSSLVEGNDVDCMIEWDSYRDGQGYYNTFYRNRLRGTPETGVSYPGYYRGRLGGEAQGSFIHRYITVIGNHVNELQGGPFPTGLAIDFSSDSTHYHYRTWVSYNVARSNQIFDPNAVETTEHENYVASGPPASWNGFDFPASLYRSVPPSWWCDESGPFPNIGAPSDSASGGYSRLPAQIRLEGGACSGTGNPAAPLPPPVILED